MFHYTTPYDCSYVVPQDRYNQFYSILNMQREAELKRQRELQKPRVVKKVETEDLYQIQIFKEYGNFNSYEVQVVKKPRNRVHVLITSEEDQFQRILEFNLNDIEVKKIDWEYFASEKVLVLNIPKKQQVAESQSFNVNPFFNFLDLFDQQQRQEAEQNRVSNSGHQKAIEYKQRADRAKQRALQKKAEAAEKKKKDVERKRQEEEEKRIHLEAEEKRRQEAKRQAALDKKRQEDDKRKADFLKAKKRAEEEYLRQQHAAEEARREEQERVRVRKAQEDAEKAERIAKVQAAAKAKAEAERVERAERERKERTQTKPIQFTGNAEDFLQQLFGAIAQQSQAASREEPRTEEEAESSKPSANYESDTGSIFSDDDVETPTASVPGSPEVKTVKLSKQPSLEEVEDEEFVMFKKKFGQ